MTPLTGEKVVSLRAHVCSHDARVLLVFSVLLAISLFALTYMLCLAWGLSLYESSYFLL
jgi:hypothetical protein